MRKEPKLMRPIHCRVKWLLHKLDSFEIVSGQSEIPEWDFSCEENEKILGIYRNHPIAREDAIVVTNCGLHLGLCGLVQYSSEWIFIDYREVETHVLPLKTAEDKLNINHLTLKMKNGREINFPLRNKTLCESGCLDSDVWSFNQFLSGIWSGLRSKNYKE